MQWGFLFDDVDVKNTHGERQPRIFKVVATVAEILASKHSMFGKVTRPRNTTCKYPYPGSHHSNLSIEYFLTMLLHR